MGEICLKEERRERLKGRGKIDRKFESVLEEEIHETLKMSKNMRRRDTMITNNQNSGFRNIVEDDMGVYQGPSEVRLKSQLG